MLHSFLDGPHSQWSECPLNLYDILKGKFPYIEHKLRRVLKNELGTPTYKLGSNLLTQIPDKIKMSFHKDSALGTKLNSFNFRRNNIVPL